MSFLAELRRRNVIKVAVLYVVAGWLMLQVAQLLFEAMELPAEWLRLVIVLLVLGFPLVLIFSWIFEVTPEGIKREKDVDRSQSITPRTGQRINTLIVVLLVLAIATVAVDRLLPESVPTSVGSPSEPQSTDAAVNEQSIAVLPFADLSPAGDQEYFSDGIAEEILNVLVRIDGLDVASRTTSWGFKGQEALGIPAIAAKMNVRHVLEGSVRKAGDTVRITAQLIDARVDKHVWSQTYDRELSAESIFHIQDEIAQAIVERLGVIIDTGGEVTATASRAADTQNLNAYELYLEAWQLFMSRHELERSIELFEKAVELDPGFARAWAGLAGVTYVAPDWGFGGKERWQRSAEAANAAIELNPEPALPYAVLGGLATRSTPGDWERSLALLDEAIRRDPREPTAHLWRGIRYMHLGYFDLAQQDFAHCLDIDPAYGNCLNNMKINTLFSGNIDLALEQHELSMRKGIPGYTFPFHYVYAERGNHAAILNEVAAWAIAEGIPKSAEIMYRAITEADFDYESERLEIEAAHRRWDGTYQGPATADYHFVYRNYAAISGDTDPYWWFPYPEAFRHSPERKRMIRERGIVDYWREQGFPPMCRPIGDDDFECD